MKTLNKKMHQVADKIGVARLGEELEYNGYLVAYMMFLNGHNIYYSFFGEELDELLNDLLTPFNF